MFVVCVILEIVKGLLLEMILMVIFCLVKYLKVVLVFLWIGF